MSIDFDWKPKLNPDGTIAFDQSDNQPFDGKPPGKPKRKTLVPDKSRAVAIGDAITVSGKTTGITKAQRLSSSFGSGRGRRAQLIRRLKSRRKYGKPVRGGTGAQGRSRRRKWG